MTIALCGLRQTASLLLAGRMTTPNSLRRSATGLLTIALLPAAGAAGAAEAGAKPVPVLIGTYTSGASQGIYACEFDPITGQLSAPQLAAAAKNAAFLALHPRGRFVYAVSEMSDASGKTGGAVAAWARDAATGQLTPLNQQASGGAGPCHVSVDQSGQCALVANYGSGSLAALPIRPDGSLGEAVSVIQHHGSGVNTNRQAGPHAHQIVTDPANRFALVCDLGLDKVFVYRLDPARATLTPNEPPFASVAPGSGPRHLVFHPQGKFVFVLNEMAATITVFQWDSATGRLTEVETVATLPADFSGANSAAELALHPSGKFLFASNRGHDSVTVLSVDAATGRLKVLQRQSAQGKAPRFIGLDPTGRWLFAANQTSGNIVSFPFDPATGKLGAATANRPAPIPVCLLFPSVPAAAPDR